MTTRPTNPCIDVVTGPPGAGKTTVAQVMAQRRSRCVLLDGDSYFQAIHTGWIPPWRPESADQNTTVVSAIGASAAVFARGGFNVIADGMIGPWMLPDFVASLGTISLRYVIIRPSADEAMRRAVGRGQPWLTDPGPISTMYEQFTDLGPYEANVIDSSHMTVEETATAVDQLLAAVTTSE